MKKSVKDNFQAAWDLMEVCKIKKKKLSQCIMILCITMQYTITHNRNSANFVNNSAFCAIINYVFSQFATEGYALLLALKLSGCASVAEIPPGFPADGSQTQQVDWLMNISRQIVAYVFQPDDVRQASNSYDHPDDDGANKPCVCRQGKIWFI